ncbi:hypothetical protein RHGRI_007291 [Rhododendron griersonianum]|uniref:Uncharacterized protein n=1 Tax=Rhododendron griersonianum TaxID=479676 RepID=A0AAV6KWE7_9ERIC|nr:hypothetical protein RHGRI_007291 [Rhododendron griersonianum]
MQKGQLGHGVMQKGQLGHGDRILRDDLLYQNCWEVESSPIRCLVSEVRDATCGADFSVWTVDLPQYGQLGHGADNEYFWHPVAVDSNGLFTRSNFPGEDVVIMEGEDVVIMEGWYRTVVYVGQSKEQR